MPLFPTVAFSKLTKIITCQGFCHVFIDIGSTMLVYSFRQMITSYYNLFPSEIFQQTSRIKHHLSACCQVPRSQPLAGRSLSRLPVDATWHKQSTDSRWPAH